MNNKPSQSGKYLTSETWDAMKAAGFTEAELEADQPFGPMVFTYTRAQAIEDGVLVDVTQLAAAVGFKVPVAITASIRGLADAAFGHDLPSGISKAKSEAYDAVVVGRLLVKALLAIKAQVESGKQSNRCYFKLDGEQVILDIGPGDDPAPVVTIMLPEDD